MEFLIICSIVDSVLRDESGHCNWGNAKGVYIIHTVVLKREINYCF